MCVLVVVICGNTLDVRSIMVMAYKQGMAGPDYQYFSLPQDGTTMQGITPWSRGDLDDSAAYAAFQRVFFVSLQNFLINSSVDTHKRMTYAYEYMHTLLININKRINSNSLTQLTFYLGVVSMPDSVASQIFARAEEPPFNLTIPPGTPVWLLPFY